MTDAERARLAAHADRRRIAWLEARVRGLEAALLYIAYEMPTSERNPDGDEQAAHSMQVVAQDVLDRREQPRDLGPGGDGAPGGLMYGKEYGG